MMIEGENNDEKTYRQAECCKESQSKECLHCRCCQKMKNWRQLHVDPIYTKIICQSYLKFLLTKPSTSDKHDIDLSRLDFNIFKMTILFVLSNIQTVYKCFQYLIITCHSIADFPITENELCFKKGSVSWKSQALWPSIHEIFNWRVVWWNKKMILLLKIRAEG